MGAQPGLGQRLREARARAGLGQRDLAGEGVSASYVSLIESGKREPTQRAVEVLAARLGVDPAHLLTGHGESALAQVRTDLAFARVALHEGRYEEARTLLRDLLQRPRVPHDLVWAAQYELAAACERLGDLREALRLLEGLRTEAEGAPDRLPWLPLVVALSRCYREVGDTAHAIVLAEAAVAQCERLGLEGLDGHPALVSTLAGLYAERGDLHRAGAVLDALIKRTDDAASPRDRAYAYWNAALNAAERGARGEALRLVEKAAALLADTEDDRNVARLKVSRAWIILNQPAPDAERALALLGQALPALRLHAGAVSVAAAEVEVARAELMLGRTDRAVDTATAALEVLGEDQVVVRARAHTVLGAARLGQGEHELGRQELARGASLLQQAGASRQAALAWRQLAEAYAAAGEADFALQAAGEALDAVGVVSEPLVAGAALTAPDCSSSDVAARAR